MFFVVGNVYAEETVTVKEFTYGTVGAKKPADDSNNIQDPVVSQSENFKSVVLNYNKTNTLNMIDAVDEDHDEERPFDAAWIGVQITEPKATLSSGEGATITAKSGLKGETKTTLSPVSGVYYEYFGVTLERLQNAIVGNGNIVFDYEVEWTVKDGSKTIGTYTQTIQVIIDASKVTLIDATKDAKLDNTLLWNADKAKLYKLEHPAATTPAEETTATEESGKDSQPKTGEEIPMALVGMMTLGLAGAYTFKKSNIFVVGNVSAETIKKPEVSKATFGAVTTSIATKQDNKDNKVTGKITQTSNADKYNGITMTYDASELILNERSQDAIINTEVAKFTATLKDYEGEKEKTVIRYSINGEKEAALSAAITLKTKITEDILKTAMAGNGKVTETYKIVYNIYDDSKDGNKEDGSDAVLVDTYTQEVTVIVNAANLILKADKDAKEEEYIWSAKIASDYKASLPATTPAEETTAPEESGKDPQPKTGEEIPMALVGMMTLGLAGAYTFKKSYIRRRQRQCIYYCFRRKGY